MKNIMAIAALAVVVVAGAVWKFSGEPTSGEVTDSTPSLANHSDQLALVPADTLFYVGGLKPVDAKDMMVSMTSLYQFADPAMWQQMNEQSMDDIFGKAESDGEKFAISMLKFLLQGLSDPQTMFEKTGAKDTLFSSIYSVGWVPVIRYEADQSRFDAFLSQLEADAQITATSKELNGVSYRAYPLGDNDSLDLVAAYHQGDAIFTLAVNKLPDQQVLAIALGIEKPAQSLKAAGTLEALQSEYNYLPDSLGYLSIQQIVSSLTQGDNLAGEMLNALDDDAEEKLAAIRSPECAAEFDGIAAQWPRWVMGYRTLDYSEKGFSGDYHMNVEIKNTALTDVLKQITGHLPNDLKTTKSDIFSLAVGLDVSRLDSIVGGIAKLAEGLQYRCELLQELNGMSDSIHGVRPVLAMSTGMAQGLKGLRMSLYDVQGDLEAGDVTAVDGLISLSGNQVRPLLNILMAMNPDVGMVTIPEDGSPVVLPLPQEMLQDLSASIELLLAATESHAAVFTGEQATAVQGKALVEPLNENGFLSFSMDYGQYMKLAGGLMDAAAQSSDMSEQEKADLDAFRNAMTSINYREQMTMRFSDKGFEIEGSIDIKNP